MRTLQVIQWYLEIDLFNYFSNCTFVAVPSHRLTTATDVFMVFLIYTLIPISLLHKIYQKLRSCCEADEEKKQKRKLDEEVWAHTKHKMLSVDVKMFRFNARLVIIHNRLDSNPLELKTVSVCPASKLFHSTSYHLLNFFFFILFLFFTSQKADEKIIKNQAENELD